MFVALFLIIMAQYIKVNAAGGGTYYYVGNTPASAYTAFQQQTGKSGSYGVISYSQFSAGLKGFGYTPPAAGVIGSATKGAAPASKPTSAAQVQPFLSAEQTRIAKESALPAVRSETQIRGELEKQGLESVELGERPEVPSLKTEYQNLREEQGVEALETTLNELRGAEDEIVASLRQRSAAQRGQGRALNVVEGRISEVERQERENLDFVQRQKSRVVEELEMRYNTISVMMNLTQQDYSNALADYNGRFQQNLSMINLVREIRQDDKDDREKAIDNARANLQIYTELISEGKLDMARLSSSEKLAIGKMEIAAGLPVGTLSKIDGRVISTNTLSNGQVQIITKNPNGTVDVRRIGTPIASASETAYSRAQSQATAVKKTAIAGVQQKAGTVKGYNTDKGWVGIFPQLVASYASTLSLDEIYNAYNSSAAGKKNGQPKEAYGKMVDIWNDYQ